MKYFIEIEFDNGALVRVPEDPENYVDFNDRGEPENFFEFGEWTGKQADDPSTFAYGIIEAWYQSDEYSGIFGLMGRDMVNGIKAVRTYAG